MQKYIRIEWPEIQDFMDRPDYETEVFTGTNAHSECWFIPEWMYEEYINEDRITVYDGIGFKNNEPLKRGSLVLLTDNNDTLRITQCISPGGAGLPPLFSGGETLLAHYIVGVNNDKIENKK